MEKNLGAIYKETMHELMPIHGEREAEIITGMLFQDLLHISKTDRILYPDQLLKPNQLVSLNNAITRLKTHEPIQHILGEAHFYGLTFKVAPHILIPRPETEELVDLIIKDHQRSEPRILDIGTGTGCIAISLAKKLPNSKVTAYDVSEDALKTAIENADLNAVGVTFQHHDILKEALWESWDVIVSNPPYIPLGEKSQMNQNVTGFDPELALFVPDNDPLIFYRTIGEKALKSLSSKGKLYFEIHESYGKETVELLERIGYQKVDLYHDFQGKDRMIRALKGT
ncbi:peptide chain release factor N(5)-glutamine methyltransferase [Marinoscillum sp. MHG1-6]|uniref:peptide chain release factor N(5)-glutamine methyltransferase n=1 Tax=Marinoscillum sp. MHG1-6 TaxID=2959627 RepID=UPI002157306B|nr:peptide chain release factor N(5)-glutamine methyltransferase [Marinoscillum sp. MHG1-6]